MHITKQKQPIWKGCILYDSNSMNTIFYKSEYDRDIKNITGFQGLGQGRDKRVELESLGTETIRMLHVIIHL